MRSSHENISLTFPRSDIFTWILRNNWGEYWGEDGFFRVERGVNALAIEDECYWAKPKAWGSLHPNGKANGKAMSISVGLNSLKLLP